MHRNSPMRLAQFSPRKPNVPRTVPRTILKLEELEPRTLLSSQVFADLPDPDHVGGDLEFHAMTDFPAGDGTNLAEFSGGHTNSCGCPICQRTFETNMLSDTGEASGDTLSNPGQLFPLEDTFLLNSNPGARHTIYLDFNGHTTSGTIWNSSFAGGQSIVTPAYDLDGNPAAFNTTEMQRIQYIWMRVSEDFIPFNVNVTTQEPAAGGLVKSGTGDTEWGVRIVIGGSSYDWYGAGAGGVAYVGSFNWSSDSPAFVFPKQLGGGAEKYVAEAISHEAGHTLGLSHDGSASVSYYAGHGSGETSWAPIMGNSYYNSVTTWSKGEYNGANNLQDDLAIITSNNGFGYRTDDHGNSNAAASGLTISGTSASGFGIIEKNTDTDVFVFSSGAGTINLQIDPFGRSSNLDILAKLYDSSNNLIATANPANKLAANLQATVAGGVYYLHISGTGNADPATNGYSDYASLGRYFISGFVPSGTDTYLSITATDAHKSEGNSGSTAFTFTVSRSGNLSQATTVDFATAGTGASPADANDFINGLLPSGTLTFQAGEATRTITVHIQGDTAIEADETFAVTLSGASSGTILLSTSATGTIVNDDEPPPPPVAPSLSIIGTDLVKPEGNSGTTPFQFTIYRTGDLTGVSSVSFSTSGFGGKNGASASDFGGTFPSGTVTFSAGQSFVVVTLYVTGDTEVERDESFRVTLSNASNAVLSVSSVDGIIQNDDSAGGGGGGGSANAGKGNGPQGSKGPTIDNEGGISGSENGGQGRSLSDSFDTWLAPSSQSPSQKTAFQQNGTNQSRNAAHPFDGLWQTMFSEDESEGFLTTGVMSSGEAGGSVSRTELDQGIDASFCSTNDWSF